MAVYHFKTIMEKFADPDNLTRASVMDAMNKATDVDTFGLIPTWSPNTTEQVLTFTRVSNPWYYSVSWNGKKFVVNKKQLNLVDELAGKHDYQQPSSA